MLLLRYLIIFHDCTVFTFLILWQITVRVKQIPEKSAVALVTFPSIGQASTTVIQSMDL